MKDGVKGGGRRRGGGVGNKERLEAGMEVRTVGIGGAEALDVGKGGGGRGHVRGEVGIHSGKIMLDMFMDKVRKEARKG